MVVSKGVERMNKHANLLEIEHKLRDCENMMRALYPDFNNARNAERFIISCLKANEALRQIQRGNIKTVDKYWRDEE
jgi:hypothetical protein